MRKALLGLLIIAGVIVVAVVTAMQFERRDNAYRVKRAQQIVHELQRLEIGKSDHTVADAIAMKFGNAPPPGSLRHYTKENCAAPDRDEENCAYIMLMNDSPVETLLGEHSFLPRLGLHEWAGRAIVVFKGGTVTDYDFIVWYRASDGRLRGFGSRESRSLPPRYEPDSARISDSYSVLRFHTVHTSPEYGMGLETVLTPAASAAEHQRASHIDFACLAEERGCGEVCETMPEAWREFYEMRGRLDVEQRGPDYLLCSASPK